ncbi:metal ABC transporter ATP-binding protein [Mycobacterium sp.]|uniref:metal ABC transporter ATP-binding protein n=1 Tax=Mycobacterium sp. TaxID=1785 RepID=UPI003BB0EF19
MSLRSNATDGAAVVFEDVSVVRDGRLIWSRGTFEVPSGGIVAVIGANGAGKTTLVQVILGLVRVAAGNVRVFDKRPGGDNNSIGYVPQNYASNSDEAIRVVDVVTLGLNGDRWAFRRTTASQRRRVDEALRSVQIAELAGKRLSRLSGGQRQRAAIAAALVPRPKLLILDEPLASLDFGTQREIVRLLRSLHADLGVTIIVVAHDLNPFLGVLDSAIYLLDGHPHYDTIDDVAKEDLLSELYGTPIEVARTPQGGLYLRGAV